MKIVRFFGFNLLAVMLIVLLSGCGASGSDESTPNTNTYDLQKVYLTKSASALLKGSYSNGITGSLSLIISDDGTSYVNGVATSNIKTDTSITLSNGYNSQNYAVEKKNSNGFMLESVAKDGTICSLTSDIYSIPSNAGIGEKSPSTSIYSCSDSTFMTLTWSLVDAGGGNAKLIIKTVITGASQSESETTITIDANSNPINYKIYVNVIANNVTGNFEGAII
jgi:hypothetical protein